MNFNFHYIGIDKRIDIDSVPIKAKSSDEAYEIGKEKLIEFLDHSEFNLVVIDDSIVVRNKYNSVVSVYTDFFVTVAKWFFTLLFYYC